ncbi:hypothetical protein PV328_012098, partial [Microctonus aethiopoides]
KLMGIACFGQMMAKKYKMRSVDLLVKTLTESETAKESAIDCISDEDGLERRMSGWESEEDADNEEFKPPEGVASQQFDLEEVVSEKRKRYGRSITRAWNLLFPDSLLEKIVRYTNEEIQKHLEALENDDTGAFHNRIKPNQKWFSARTLETIEK